MHKNEKKNALFVPSHKHAIITHSIIPYIYTFVGWLTKSIPIMQMNNAVYSTLFSMFSSTFSQVGLAYLDRGAIYGFSLIKAVLEKLIFPRKKNFKNEFS